LTVNEFNWLDLLCAGTNIPMVELLTRSISLDAATYLEFGREQYLPRHPFAQLLLSLTEDRRFRGIPLKLWLWKGCAFLLIQALPEDIDSQARVIFSGTMQKASSDFRTADTLETATPPQKRLPGWEKSP
jgi:hypothetical protein